MKNHIVLKFLAVMLCAAMLLGAAGSALGIFALTEAGLYDRSVEEILAQRIDSDASSYAHEIARRYASENLGSCPEELIDSYYGSYWFYNTFQPGYYHYTLLDAEGSVLSTGGSESLENARTYTYPVSGQYMNLVALMTEAEMHPPQTFPQDQESYENNSIPASGAGIYGVEITFSDGSGFSSTDAALGTAYYTQNGNLVFDTQASLCEPTKGQLVTHAVFWDESGTVLYDAYSPEGVGILYCDENLTSFISNSSFAFVPEIIPPQSDPLVHIAIPPEGTAVSNLSVTLADGSSQGYGSDEEIGIVFYNQNGNVVFRDSSRSAIEFTSPAVVTAITLYSSDGQIIYLASSPDGVGILSYGENGNVIFTSTYAEAASGSPRDDNALTDSSESASEESFPEETIPEATAASNVPMEPVPEATEDAKADALQADASENSETIPDAVSEDSTETIPENALPSETTIPTVPEESADFAAATQRSSDVEIIRYYDHSTGESMYAECTYVQMPQYTVTLQLAPGAVRYESGYALLYILQSFRDYLIPALAVCLILFAVIAVYLCCSAGKAPRTDLIKPGGLNAMSLDLYLVLLISGLAVLGVAGIEGTGYLLQQNIQVACVFAIAAGYAAALLLVGFCFACAAQFKTPGGYWWHNTLLVRSLVIFVHFFHWLFKFLATKLFPALRRFCKALWRILLSVTRWLWKTAARGFRWSVGKLHRFLSLLPLTWQWLLTGFSMTMMLYIALRSYKVGWILVGFGLFFGIILYGTSAFGILLESTRRMNQGDLDTKVDDKLLIGSFRDFAENLNDLADVAVVAAQKQLKSERMKTELITNVSHDIKTPLTSIINYVDLLQKPHTAQEQEQYLDVLSRQSLRLKKLIDDLMEMSKASTGNMAVDITRVDAAESVNQALGEFADKLERAQLTPVFRHPDTPVMMMADGRLVWRVLSNLLGNAVKYALPGTRLYIDLMELEDKVLISLKNISREELNVDAEELLERFVRGDAARNTEGSGLGLNIAKSLTELQKGQLQILVDGDLFKVTLIFPSA